MYISIIIPVLNEEKEIGHCLDHLGSQPGQEIIVVDGGSTDRTVQTVRRRRITCLQTRAGRGWQQNQGALAATGEILLFLHCDCRLPPQFQNEISMVLARPNTVAGAFRLALDEATPVYRFLAWGANWRSRILKLPYGDQGLFMPRHILQTAGGFPEIPLMEDVDLVRRLGRLGHIGLARSAILASARRYRQIGILKSVFLNQLLLAAFLLHADPRQLHRIYYRLRH